MTAKNLKWPLVATLVIAGGLYTLRTGSAQEAVDGADVLIAAPVPGPASPVKVPLDVVKLKTDAAAALVDGKIRAIVAMRGNPERMQEIRDAAKALSEAEGQEDRQTAEQELTQLLNNYFEEDMERREQELAQVENRVKKLRELLERRREKKQDIVELQIQVLQNEADGLGFFGSDVPGSPLLPWEARIEAVPAYPPAVPAPPRAVMAPQPGSRGGYRGYRWFGLNRNEDSREAEPGAEDRTRRGREEREEETTRERGRTIERERESEAGERSRR
jgi:hypothetical protein